MNAQSAHKTWLQYNTRRPQTTKKKNSSPLAYCVMNRALACIIVVGFGISFEFIKVAGQLCGRFIYVSWSRACAPCVCSPSVCIVYKKNATQSDIYTHDRRVCWSTEVRIYCFCVKKITSNNMLNMAYIIVLCFIFFSCNYVTCVRNFISTLEFVNLMTQLLTIISLYSVLSNGFYECQHNVIGLLFSKKIFKFYYCLKIGRTWFGVWHAEKRYTKILR